ncbi:hypothetical protein [Streptomyces yunnanensis]|uniref:Uncharacterized protein n=1 Tax=Streptomyces yunnanensis TaxID=156453 RepID=A0A9X8N535_9ACTN|nr:hypothetical protein [Streptomyces yunnanensis]SHN01330.1 hypothetical protein SAMN05216268_117185 [Streptomyces yunnanensis]
MPENFKELLKQDFSDLEASVKSWRKLAKALEEAQVRHRHKVTGPLHASEWQGTDSHYAFMQMEASETQLGTAQSDVTSIATVLDTAHTKMKEAQEDLRRCVRTTELDGYTVDDQGNVTDSRPGPTGDADDDAQEEHNLRVAKLESYKNDTRTSGCMCWASTRRPATGGPWCPRGIRTRPATLPCKFPAPPTT